MNVKKGEEGTSVQNDEAHSLVIMNYKKEKG